MEVAIGGDVRRANVGLLKTQMIAQSRATGQEEAYQATEKVLGVMAEAMFLLPFAALVGASALIVLALTRPRSRDFFDSPN